MADASPRVCPPHPRRLVLSPLARSSRMAGAPEAPTACGDLNLSHRRLAVTPGEEVTLEIGNASACQIRPCMTVPDLDHADPQHDDGAEHMPLIVIDHPVDLWCKPTEPAHAWQGVRWALRVSEEGAR